MSISAKIADWEREKLRKAWDPGRRLIQTIRRFQALRGKHGPVAWIARNYWRRAHQFWSVITQNEIQLTTKIGGGLLLTHPNGIVIHPEAVIGPNCLIFNQVTIGRGKAGPDGRTVPVIGGHVDIAAGARIVGGITIGNHAVIGLNAVVLSDVPDGGVAVGVPARVIRINPVPEDPA
ncbi:serine O-acetyltransferase [Falsirhodobacter deserti]|uniref:serine O-acetyltransferase n=1 Tax=Falsirhodobacter deserti TaxID=1365611 RepID=UPI000FE34AF8|nr:serine acetyltransferase [Falsirhodobacter deserti]